MKYLKFLSGQQVRSIAEHYGTPVFVYSEAKLREAARQVLDFPSAYGLTARYAMKANPNGSILSLFDGMGLHFDASSSYEVHRLLMNGVAPSHIQLTTQQLPEADDLEALVNIGVIFNASSLHQMAAYGKLFPGGTLSVRINPGIGSGHANRVNVGGPASSFGVWIEHLDTVKVLAKKYGLTVDRLHSHIGSGSDPDVWEKVTAMNLGVVKSFPEVHTLNMGGGYKIGRLPGEETTDLQLIGSRVKKDFEQFYKDTGRKIRLEIEPGNYLVAAGGALVTAVNDKTDTGKDGYVFLKTDTGMSDFLRPTLYGSRHVINYVPRSGARPGEHEEVVIVGHCCESGDILTPVPGDSEGVDTETLPKANIGDFLVIEDAGAYCASMNAANYNSFPQVQEVLIREDGSFELIRKKQTMEQMVQNEILS